MPDFLDPRVIFIILQLIYLEGILSIDNAAVLGAMVSPLPRHDPIPWPRPLRFLERPVHRLLGGQRPAALKVGLLGAYLGRGSMLFLASWVIRNPWLLLLGGLYLIKLGVEHLGETPAEARAAAAKAEGQPLPRTERGFWSVVLAVELADLAFSLDNVVAAVALSREFWVVMTGVALGIITMRFAAGIFVYLIDRFPELEAAAYLLVLSIGLGLVVEDFFHIKPDELQRFLISLSIIAATLAYGRIPAVHRIGRHLAWVKRVVGYVDLLFVAALRPLVWLGGVGRAVFLFVATRPSPGTLRGGAGDPDPGPAADPDPATGPNSASDPDPASDPGPQAPAEDEPEPEDRVGLWSRH